MNMYLHGTSTLSVLLYGEKKAKDLVIGDKILCCIENQVTLLSVISIETEDYNNWSKVTYSNEEEVIFDRQISLDTNQKFESLLDEDVIISHIKDYNKTSKGYKIILEDSFDDIYINNIFIKDYNNE